MPSITEKKNSPNHFNGRNGWKPDMIVCHITEGGYAGAVSWLCNTQSQASSHFVVAADGRIAQLVDLTNGSWCNGNSTDPNSRLYYKNSLNSIVRSRATNANYYTYSIEHEGYSYKDRYGALTEAQYQATLWLCKYIISETKRLYGIDIPIDREHIIGHYEIDPVGKPNCPAPNKGANFPFDRLIADLKAGQFNADKFVGKHLIVKKDTTLYSTAGYSGYTTSIIKAGEIVYCEKLHTANGTYMALKKPDKSDYLSPAAWAKDFNNFEVTIYNPIINIESISITNISTEIEVGDSLELSIIIKPDNATNKDLQFRVEGDAVAVNDNGIVKALKPGISRIFVSSGNIVSSIDITVYKEDIIIPEPEKPIELEELNQSENSTDNNQLEGDNSQNVIQSAIQKLLRMIVNILTDFFKKIFRK